jgi:prolyl-tRNA synthetase
MDQLMSGSWNLLPMGLRVVQNINNIIREELDKIGCQEILMPLLHPKEIWNETGRWESADEIMYKLKDSRDKEFVLSFTHEEIFLDLVRKHIKSYADLPVALYHFSTKFRNELRARSGILRGREFMMKDLYSVHESEKDFNNFYNEVRKAYLRIFERIGFKTYVTQSGGGVFTENFTHEFQVIAEGGEDTIYVCSECDWAANNEVFDPEIVKKPLETKYKKVCHKCGSKVEEKRAIEVGNTFEFGQTYSKKMNVKFTKKDGSEEFPYFGSYGIGSTRVMGSWVEIKKGHDDKGIIWSKTIAPFNVHLIEVTSDKKRVKKNTENVYKKLRNADLEVLWDGRQVSAGEKFNDADLIGIPVRLVVSEKTEDKVEWKARSKEKVEMLSLEDVLERLST